MWLWSRGRDRILRGLEEEMVGVIFLVRRLFNERGDGGGGRGVATWAGRGGPSNDGGGSVQ